ncbi:capsular biosynthesis protein [Burkholderia diffusa]|uniref:Capsular biosynthesis protein n=1 Tax=Burkholderia diffusa TaxID=488732 RepID=A0AAW3PI56_9BURK|nr:LTA synthase family protein [Burkholderia diffusa]KWF34532.1 capsular biosynthesis protein [Burkholderia diffusa]KWF47753.1 capsular biosynthesis protein [Burkholderia diffusa]KWF52661.1 capsular biosynthesis protein [Burkholderia diffusa]KWF55218.1 capsular biosynthesis protein [Burkholderia diffusa]
MSMLNGSVALTVSFMLSLLMDGRARPFVRAARTRAAWGLHGVVLAYLFFGLLAVSGRVGFSAVVTVALNALMIVVSNAKFSALREPFVFTDLSLFSQLFAHPRLYLPFLGGKNLLGIAVGVFGLGLGYFADHVVPGTMRLGAMMAACLCLALACWFSTMLDLSLDPITDQVHYGFFPTFVAYLLNGLRWRTSAQLRSALAAAPFAHGDEVGGADVIVIQSESYFDSRRTSSSIHAAAYARFDQACGESIVSGKLEVPAWGANTMRTEFAVLTGLSSEDLGYSRFYPYAFLRRACSSLAARFRRAGYTTVAIHPYHADFFGRDRVFPLLGFERFLDIRHFSERDYVGAYVGDHAVAEAIIAELERGDAQPRFVFAMTMENHGPLHLEQVLPGESSSRHTLGEDASWRDLTAYLRHIENADAMIGRLLDYLRTSSRETVVCFYGDHVPALSHVFHKLDVDPKNSDYFIWRNYGAVAPERRDLAAEELGVALLRVIQDEGNRTRKPCVSEKAT